jgi:serine/threonine protein kinase
MTSVDLCMGCMEVRGPTPACPSCGWREDQVPDSPLYLLPRAVLQNQYLLGRVLGHGGFGITYLGWDLNLATKLAVKEYFPSNVATRASGTVSVRPYGSRSEQDYQWGLEKFLEEARVLARFQNQPGIVSVFNFFRANETAYLVMEYLQGVTLERYLEDRGGRIPVDHVIRFLTPVMSALCEVHRAGILHRDISPDNIHINSSSQVKLLDFGAARYALGQQSKNLSVILKEGFAPEEQYRTKGLQGPWTDVYATAATIYKSITGIVPTPALDRLENDDLVPPSSVPGVIVTPQLEACLMKGLAVRAPDRFQSMEDFRAALTGDSPVAISPPTTALNTLRYVAPVPEPQPEPLPIPEPLSPSRTWLAWVWAAAGILVLAAFGYFFTHRTSAPSAATPAQPSTARNTQPAPAPNAQPAPDNNAAINSVPPPGRDISAPAQSPVPPNPPATPPAQPPSSNNSSPPVAPPSPQPRTEARNSIAPAGAPGANAPATAQTFGIDAFDAQPANIRAGQSAILRWSVRGAQQVSISPSIGTVGANGQANGAPRANTTYVLSALSPTQTLTRRVEVIVSPGSAPASVNAPVRSWTVVHDHGGVAGAIRGISGLGANRRSVSEVVCVGTLTLQGKYVRFRSRTTGDRFDRPVSSIAEVHVNRLSIEGRHAFHIRFDDGQNYNFIPEANDQEIVDAIQAAMNR